MRRSALILTLVGSCGLLACGKKGEDSGEVAAEIEAPAGSSQVAPKEPEPEPEPEPELVPAPPRWLLVPWNTKLRVLPQQYAPALTLLEPEESEEQTRGRVLRVVGKADEAGTWWQLESVDRVDEAGIGDPVVEGLGVYELTLYVPAGTGIRLGEEAPPESRAGETDGSPEEPKLDKPEAANAGGILAMIEGPPLQSGEPRPAQLETEWRVDPGVSVYWPDGTPAGTVRHAHAFVEAGEASEEKPGRTCFGVRVGPRLEPLTKLCFARDDVHEAKPVNPFASDALLGESPFGELSDEDMAQLFDHLEALDSSGGLGTLEGIGSFGEMELEGSTRGGGNAAGMGGMGTIGTGKGGGGSATSRGAKDH